MDGTLLICDDTLSKLSLSEAVIRVDLLLNHLGFGVRASNVTEGSSLVALGKVIVLGGRLAAGTKQCFEWSRLWVKMRLLLPIASDFILQVSIHGDLGTALWTGSMVLGVDLLVTADKHVLSGGVVTTYVLLFLV